MLALAIALIALLSQPLLLIFGGLVFASMLDGGTRLLGRVLPIGRGWRLLIVTLAALAFMVGTVWLADRSDGRALTPLRKADNYSVDVGGAYSLTRNIAVTGGVRYRIDHDRLSAVTDARRDSQAVYVGTAFKF